MKLTDLAFLGWSSDGAKFAATVPASIGLPQEPLYVVNADGTGSQRIDGFQYGIAQVSVGWSRDSTRLAFGGLLDRVTPSGIWTVRSDGSLPSQVTQGHDTNPAWSPDDTRIAFERQSDTSSPAIYIVNIDGTGLAKLGDGSNFGPPQWSPDGRRITFVQDGRVVSVFPDGTNLRYPTTGPYDSAVQWSPDGSKLLVTRSNPSRLNEAGVSTLDLYTINPDGTHERLIASNVNLGAVWSPDSRKVAFTATSVGGLSDLWVVAGDGSEAANLTNSANAGELLPDWQPIQAPKRSDYKNSAQFCKAEQAFWGDQFSERGPDPLSWTLDDLGAKRSRKESKCHEHDRRIRPSSKLRQSASSRRRATRSARSRRTSASPIRRFATG